MFNRPPQSATKAGRPIATAAGLCLGLLLSTTAPASAQELVIGEERVEPGIVLIFEGAVRDLISPTVGHLPEDLTHVHIEARVNWDEAGIPEGTPPGGFVPYLNITALVQNEMTREINYVSLTPHINLIDNFHYARNMQLPGGDSDPYSVYFYVYPPDTFALGLHRDWFTGYGHRLMMGQAFVYRNVNFSEIVNAPPRSQ